MPEFTGERVVPGLVDLDLLNEHRARYEFAKRFARGKHVLDAGCGSGYGAASLATTAFDVLGIDSSEEAIEYAQANYSAANLRFEIASCTAIPGGQYDLIVAFEVIEHLAEWRELLAEARRALAPDGRFIVSTPNRLYYAESRGESGSNPFHVHEFEFAEFEGELKALFPGVTMFLQNHTEGVMLSPLAASGLEAIVDKTAAAPEEAHFFVAVCGFQALPSQDAFLWIPAAGNVLREREHHIALLNGEVALKTEWLARAKSELDNRNREYEEILTKFRDLNAKMEERNRWALEWQAEAQRRGSRILELQDEIAREQTGFKRTADAYEGSLAESARILRERTEWAFETERRLTADVTNLSADLEGRVAELARCVTLLDQAEQTVTERTQWAQGLQREVADLQEQLSTLRNSFWVKMGSKSGLVPNRR